MTVRYRAPKYHTGQTLNSSQTINASSVDFQLLRVSRLEFRLFKATLVLCGERSGERVEAFCAAVFSAPASVQAAPTHSGLSGLSWS